MTDTRTRTKDRAAEKSVLEDLGIRRVRTPLEGDGRGDPQSYVTALREIRQAEASGEPLLFHCQSGVQRTGGTVALYRIFFQGRGADEVLRELRAHDWRPGRDDVLIEFLDANMEEIGRRLVESGLISAVPSPLPRLSGGAKGGP